MQACRDIFALWPTTKDMAADLGMKPDRVRKWKKFKRIPGDSVQAVVKAVRQRGVEVTTDQILELNAPMRKRGRPSRRRRARSKQTQEARA